MDDVARFFSSFVVWQELVLNKENRYQKDFGRRSEQERMGLQVEYQQIEKVLVVRLKGELDHHTTGLIRAQLEEKINQEGITHLILNLKDLSFMDSSGLGVLLGRYKQLAAKQGEMVICSAGPTISRILDLAGIFKIITLKETEEEALSTLGVRL